MEQSLLAAVAASASSNTLNVDSLIQSALAAGIPPLQVVQFIQQRQAIQQQHALTSVATNALQQHQLSTSQTPIGSSGSSTTGQSHAPAISGFSLANAAAVLASQHPQTATAAHQQAQQMASLLHHAQQQQAQAHNAQQVANDANSSLPWPIFQPTVNVPYFDINMYKKVNLDVQASALPSGMDLPLNDMNTLRFFFNFGVHHARAILLREHFQTPNGPQPGSQTGQQTQVSNVLLSLQHQDPLLYQQALLKSSSDSLTSTGTTASKQMVNSMPASTSAATDSNSVYQLQRDLSTSISINQLQNTLAQMNKINSATGQVNNSIGQPNMASQFKTPNEQIEALLLQNSILGQSNQAMQLRLGNVGTNTLSNIQQPQQQTQHPEGLHRPTAIMPSSIPLASTIGTKQTSGQTVATGNQQSQNSQVLGALGISPIIAQQQVPVDPAPRGISGVKTSEIQVLSSTASSIAKPTPGISNSGPLTSSVLASFLQDQQAHERMKATSLVRGAVSDQARPIPTNPPVSSASPAQQQTNLSTTSASLTVAAPFGGNGQQISLAAQLSMAIMQNAYQQKQNGAGNNGTSTVTPVSNADNSTEKSSNNVNPDAHLLAGTSPFVKLITTAAVTRPLTSITTQQQVTTSTSSTVTTTASQAPPTTNDSTGISHPYLMGPFGGADLDPTTFLATTELNYTEVFRRSHDQRRKSGINMLTDESSKKETNEKPIAPTMINYVNSCLSQLKSQVQSHGVVLPVDSNFRPIDYSSRPIDPIFRKAREQLERDRDYIQNRSSVSPTLLQRLNTNQSDNLGESNLLSTSDDGSSSATPIIKPRCLSEQPTENLNSEDAPERKRQRLDESPQESTISSV